MTRLTSLGISCTQHTWHLMHSTHILSLLLLLVPTTQKWKSSLSRAEYKWLSLIGLNYRADCRTLTRFDLGLNSMIWLCFWVTSFCFSRLQTLVSKSKQSKLLDRSPKLLKLTTCTISMLTRFDYSNLDSFGLILFSKESRINPPKTELLQWLLDCFTISG